MDEKQIQKMAILQLESLLKLAGESIVGTSTEMSIKLALEVLKTDDTPQNDNKSNTADKTKEKIGSWGNDDYDDDNDEDVEGYYDEMNDPDYDDDNVAPVVPEGFGTEENYQTFIESQADLLPEENDELGNVIIPRPDDVVGSIEDENGNIVDFGTMDESLDKVTEHIEEQNTIRDEEGNVLYHNEIDPIPYIRVSFTRNDGEELTREDLEKKVFTNRASKPMLDNFGSDYVVLSGDSPSEKIVSFYINNNDEKQKKVSQAIMNSQGMMQFAGHTVIPRIGLVTAKAIV